MVKEVLKKWGWSVNKGNQVGHLTFFKGGVHPEEYKELTHHIPIQNFSQPTKVYLHLNQHMGPPAKAVVKRGDKVRRGQVIAEGGEQGVPVHASISGKVFNVGRAYHPSLVEAEAVIIESTSDAEPELDFPEDPEWKKLPQEVLLQRIKDAGIVGLGGAAFPTYKKLKLPPSAKVDTLIINGAECEPYLTTDHRLMLEKGEEILWGAWLMARLIGVKAVKVGIENNKPDAAEHLKKVLNHSLQEEQGMGSKAPSLVPSAISFDVHLTHTRYPQGSEKQLIQALTGRNVPARKLPMDVGVVVQNVATALAVYEAAKYQRPLLDRVVTVSGLGIFDPKNVRVPLGTQLIDLVQYCGGTKDNVVKIINGGPMMGRTVPTMEIPIIKGTNGFLFLTSTETHMGGYDPCIMCGRCVEVCPLGLEPHRISTLVEVGHPLETESFGTHECFECGCCSYACPSKRPLVQFIQVSKNAYRKDQQRKAQS